MQVQISNYSLRSFTDLCYIQAGFIDPKLAVAKVKPVDFEDAAKRACETSLDQAKTTYPRVEADNLPYLCMDLVYQYTLLVDGFGMLCRLFSFYFKFITSFFR